MTLRCPDGQPSSDRIATHQKLLTGLADPRWYSALAGGGLAVALLGFWGYWSRGDGTHSASDAVYGTIKLFAWGATLPPDQHVGLSLNLARFLAPLVSGWAAGIALVSMFRDRAQQMLVPFIRGHVVVCGLGYVGFEFARKLHNAGYRAVVIEADATNPQINVCRGWGFPVVVGDGRLASTLTAAGVRRAVRLLAVTPDSAVNTEILTRARALVSGRSVRPARPARVFGFADPPALRCLARISDSRLCVLLRTASTNRGAESTVDFFNIDEIGARLLLDRYAINTADQPHIVVAHLGALGSAVVFHAARRWHDERGTNAAPLCVTVIDDRADERVSILLAEHPALEEVCVFRCYSSTVRDIDRLAALDSQSRVEAARTGTVDGVPATPVSHVYVTESCDERTIETALSLRRALDPSVLVVAALTRAHAIANLLEDKTTLSGLNVAAFRTLQEACSIELVEGGSLEAIAREIHRRYCEMQPKERQPPPWPQLDDSVRASNHAQALHIGVKLRSIGCEIVPLRHWNAKDFRFTDDELRKLAIMEHDRWWREKEAAGFTLGEADTGRRKDPHLVPWEELPPDVADWDRRFVQAIPEMLAAVGLQIVDVRGISPRYPTDEVEHPAERTPK